MLAWIVDHWTLLTVAALALLFYGSRLPEVARSLGRSVSEFKKGLRDIQEEVGREDDHSERDADRPKLRPPTAEHVDEPPGQQTKEPVVGADTRGDKTD